MRRLLGILALLLVAGCPSDDQGGGPDAPSAGGGLTLTWLTRPDQVPGPVDARIELVSATFHLRDLRVVGDAGAGDPRTTAARVELTWSAGVAPAPLVFPDAPPGLYARVLAEVDRGAEPYAYQLTGTVDVDGTRLPFLVRDTEAVPIDFDFSVTAAPGVRTAMVVRVDLDEVARSIDFEVAPVVEGVRVIGPSDPQLPAIRDEIDQAFGVHESDQPRE